MSSTARVELGLAGGRSRDGGDDRGCRYGNGYGNGYGNRYGDRYGSRRRGDNNGSVALAALIWPAAAFGFLIDGCGGGVARQLKFGSSVWTMAEGDGGGNLSDGDGLGGFDENGGLVALDCEFLDDDDDGLGEDGVGLLRGLLGGVVGGHLLGGRLLSGRLLDRGLLRRSGCLRYGFLRYFLGGGHGFLDGHGFLGG